jgi:hypothetical protein
MSEIKSRKKHGLDSNIDFSVSDFENFQIMLLLCPVADKPPQPFES